MIFHKIKIDAIDFDDQEQSQVRLDNALWKNDVVIRDTRQWKC